MYFALFFLSFFCGQLAACSFCNPQVISSQLVFEGTHLYVLVDHAPRAYGHLLIVPKRHVEKFHELAPEEGQELLPILQKSIAVFQKVIGTTDYMVLEKNGYNAWQNVPHVHFHIVPVHESVFRPTDYHAVIHDLFSRGTAMDKEALALYVSTFKEAFQNLSNPAAKHEPTLLHAYL